MVPFLFDIFPYSTDSYVQDQLIRRFALKSKTTRVAGFRPAPLIPQQDGPPLTLGILLPFSLFFVTVLFFQAQRLGLEPPPAPFTTDKEWEEFGIAAFPYGTYHRLFS